MQKTYLVHHGIKGQHWGVRRFQNEDGSLTKEGQERYNESDPKDKDSKEIKKFSDQKVSDISSDKTARNRKIAKGILIGVGATAITAAVAYGIYKHGKDRTDQIISQGSIMQRVEKYNDSLEDQSKRKLWDIAYVSNNKFDNESYLSSYGYKMGFGKDKVKGHEGEIYKLGIEAKKNLKIASPHSSFNSFKEISKNPEFLSKFKTTEDLKTLTTTENRKIRTVSNATVKKFLNGKKVSQSQLKRIYENYNQSLTKAHTRENSKEASKLFYDQLRKNGYNGLVDINDYKYSGIRTKNPLIIFDSESNLNIKSVAKASYKDINLTAASKSFVKTSMFDIGQKSLTVVAPLVGTGSLFTAGALSVQDAKKNNKTTKKK